VARAAIDVSRARAEDCEAIIRSVNKLTTACRSAGSAGRRGWVAPISRQVAREEKHGAITDKIDARNNKGDASTEIRIASQKNVAAPSEKDDAADEKVESTVGKMVASSDLVLGSDEKAGASADEIDAANKKVDASIENVDSTQKVKSERTK
jgi:hypothetical protein